MRKAGRTGQMRRKRGGPGKAAGFVLLVLTVIFVLQHERIRQWYLEKTGFFGIQLESEDDQASLPLALRDPSRIPEYDGALSVELNGNIPSFTEYNLTHTDGENYSDPDNLGRCGSAVAMLDAGMMPAGEREEISMIRPSGFRQAKYPGIIDSDPPYLYHRCHLIAWALTGQNANEKNLITGTQHMNMDGMRPFEVQVARCLDKEEGQILYRVTPLFRGDELLARGVEMEAYSVWDSGRELCFHVFVYNVQPGISIDYRTGESRAA